MWQIKTSFWKNLAKRQNQVADMINMKEETFSAESLNELLDQMRDSSMLKKLTCKLKNTVW